MDGPVLRMLHIKVGSRGGVHSGVVVVVVFEVSTEERGLRSPDVEIIRQQGQFGYAKSVGLVTKTLLLQLKMTFGPLK
jgi:hypothetical protein